MTPPADPASQLLRKGRVTLAALLAFGLLLILPAYALSRLTDRVDWRLLAALPVAVSLFTYLAYRSDKRCAEAGEWRIPESTLHFSELIGGWPGAFLAQRMFRHKISKASYQFTFWFIILAHQFVALDFLLGWRIASSVLKLF